MTYIDTNPSVMQKNPLRLWKCNPEGPCREFLDA
jgi:hypothetical protein